MAEFLDNNDDRIRQEMLTYYRFRTNLLMYIGERLESLKNTIKSSEYDYCTNAGQLKELEHLDAFVREQGKHTEISKIAESTNKKN
jgi:hypothetical protein